MWKVTLAANCTRAKTSGSSVSIMIRIPYWFGRDETDEGRHSLAPCPLMKDGFIGFAEPNGEAWKMPPVTVLRRRGGQADRGHRCGKSADFRRTLIISTPPGFKTLPDPFEQVPSFGGRCELEKNPCHEIIMVRAPVEVLPVTAVEVDVHTMICSQRLCAFATAAFENQKRQPGDLGGLTKRCFDLRRQRSPARIQAELTRLRLQEGVALLKHVLGVENRLSALRISRNVMPTLRYRERRMTGCCMDLILRLNSIGHVRRVAAVALWRNGGHVGVNLEARVSYPRRRRSMVFNHTRPARRRITDLQRRVAHGLFFSGLAIRN
jgi:hypothetical protein